jgi:exosortase
MLLWCAAAFAVFPSAVRDLVRLGLSDERFSHILVVPFISAGLIWWKRRRILPASAPSRAAGACLLLPGLLLASGAAGASRSIVIAGLVLILISGFALIFGYRSAWRAAFPLCLLFLMVPPPEFVLAHAIRALQESSTWLTHALLGFIGVPVYRTGFGLSLPGLDIEVAEQCSGIRSTAALLICSLATGYVYLRSIWAKSLFVAIALVVVVLKNALRIATMAYLAVYVDHRVLSGALHEFGGMLFSLVALAVAAPALLALQRTENRSQVVRTDN